MGRKRILFSLVVLLCLTVQGIAQSINLQEAIKQTRDRDFKEAKKWIEKAANHDETKNDPKTWYYKGHIYMNIARDTSLKGLMENPIKKAMEAYEKCSELDSDEQYKQKIQVDKMQLAGFAFQKGVENFNGGEFEEALYYFDVMNQVRGRIAMARVMKKIKDEQSKGKNMQEMDVQVEVKDTNAWYSMYYTGLAAENLDRDSVAMMNYTWAGASGLFGAKPYIRLVTILKKRGETDRMIKVIEGARKEFPDNSTLLNMEADYYLSQKKYDKAVSSLKGAIEKQPDNKELKFVLGNVYGNIYEVNWKNDSTDVAMKYFKKAESTYKGLIEKHPDYFDPNQELGLLYYNHGVEMYTKGQAAQDDKKSDEYMKKFKSYLNKAKPYLKKAHEIDPDDKRTMKSLLKVYGRLGETKKYKEMKKKFSGG